VAALARRASEGLDFQRSQAAPDFRKSAGDEDFAKVKPPGADKRNGGNSARRGASGPATAPNGITCKEGSLMARNRLRVYYGPEEPLTTITEASSARQMVKVPVGEVLPLLLEAARSQRAWLDDFSDDEMTISSDLYEVLLAYQHFRRPSA
jgi:hypothetical protein